MGPEFPPGSQTAKFGQNTYVLVVTFDTSVVTCEVSCLVRRPESCDVGGLVLGAFIVLLHEDFVFP